MTVILGRYSKAAIETVIEANLLANGYVSVAAGGFDRDRAIFPDTVLAFIRETQPLEWARLEALHGDRTGEQVLTDLCEWMDANGSLAQSHREQYHFTDHRTPLRAHNCLGDRRNRRVVRQCSELSKPGNNLSVYELPRAVT